MNDKRRDMFKMGITLLLVLLFSGAFLFFVDTFFNGWVIDWINNHFLSIRYDAAGIGYAVLNTSEVKRILICVFIFGALLIAVGVMLFSRFYLRRKEKEHIQQTAEYMQLFMAAEKDFPPLPREYAPVEMQLTQIRAREQRREQLLQEETQQKNDLITYLAHDLKTPLASVIGYLSLLSEVEGMPEPQRQKYTGIALEKANRLEQLINEFFEITRFNLHSIVLNPSRIALSFMLEQMADEFYPLLAPQQKEIQVDVPKDFTILGDADKLARVFNNILKNALAYSDPCSTIVVKAAKEEKNMVLRFINQGAPIPAHQLERIFEKFYRLDSARSSQSGGSGLGLAIAREIVEAHGGTIQAQSGEKGTVFTVSLPA